MDRDFAEIEKRAAALRLTVPELVQQVEGVSWATFWRARKGNTGTAARVRALRSVEARLDAIEQERGR